MGKSQVGKEKHPQLVPGYADLKTLAQRIVIMRHDARAALYREIAEVCRKDAEHDLELQRPKHATRMENEAAMFRVLASIASDTWDRFRKYME